MSKKNFTSGLDTLFDNALEDVKIQQEKDAPKPSRRATTKSKANDKKSFTSDLDALFQEAIEETVVEEAERIQQTKDKAPKSSTVRKKRRKKPLFGIDALIRQTVETSKVENAPRNMKRVTFVFDKDRLTALKKIARVEKAYIKDIVRDIVAQYVDKYDIDPAASA